MKVGDFVGWADSWDDERGCEVIGLIIREHVSIPDDCYSEYFDVLESATGDILKLIPKEDHGTIFGTLRLWLKGEF